VVSIQTLQGWKDGLTSWKFSRIFLRFDGNKWVTGGGGGTKVFLSVLIGIHWDLTYIYIYINAHAYTHTHRLYTYIYFFWIPKTHIVEHFESDNDDDVFHLKFLPYVQCLCFSFLLLSLLLLLLLLFCFFFFVIASVTFTLLFIQRYPCIYDNRTRKRVADTCPLHILRKSTYEGIRIWQKCCRLVASQSWFTLLQPPPSWNLSPTFQLLIDACPLSNVQSLLVHTLCVILRIIVYI
jgi:hypothetical protein